MTASLGIRLAIVVVLAVAITVIGSGVAQGVEQGGYTVGSGDGMRASIDVSTVTVGSYCVLWSTLVYNSVSAVQVEAGLVCCPAGSGGIDGTCNGVKFVETDNGGTYICFGHGSFSNGTAYQFSVVRDSATSSDWSAYVGSTKEECMPFSYAPDYFTWGEETPATTCTGWTGLGVFTSWQYHTSSPSAWHTISSATKYKYPNNASNCWYITAFQGAGAFNVSH